VKVSIGGKEEVEQRVVTLIGPTHGGPDLVEDECAIIVQETFKILGSEYVGHCGNKRESLLDVSLMNDREDAGFDIPKLDVQVRRCGLDAEEEEGRRQAAPSRRAFS
jgi:hypothetical protein